MGDREAGWHYGIDKRDGGNGKDPAARGKGTASTQTHHSKPATNRYSAGSASGKEGGCRPSHPVLFIAGRPQPAKIRRPPLYPGNRVFAVYRHLEAAGDIFRALRPPAPGAGKRRHRRRRRRRLASQMGLASSLQGRQPLPLKDIWPQACRYSTTGSSVLSNAQPFVTPGYYAIGLAATWPTPAAPPPSSGAPSQSTMDTEVIVHLAARLRSS